MKAVGVLVVIFLISSLSLGGLFIGSIAGEMFRGNASSFGEVEAGILVAFFMISVQGVIIYAIREKKSKPISHYVNEARKITY